MSQHLTKVQIERYVSRSATVDEILAAAQHLNECFDCRDTAAALVDPGSEISHTRPASGPMPKQPAQGQVLTPWLIVTALLAAVITIAIMLWTA